MREERLRLRWSEGGAERGPGSGERVGEGGGIRRKVGRAAGGRRGGRDGAVDGLERGGAAHGELVVLVLLAGYGGGSFWGQRVSKK